MVIWHFHIISVPPDWFNQGMAELDQDDELNQSVEQSSADTRCNQVFAYMLEEC